MKIAIFGDSYGDDRFGELPEQSWVSILKEKLDITNFSFTGSGIFYSYDLFLKNHANFDRIIFLVTSSDRITLPNDSPLAVFKHVNYTQAKVWAERTNGQQQKDYQLILDYYEKIHNQDQSTILHKLLIQDVKRIRPDSIVYPCFSFEYFSEYPLYNITSYEDKYIGINDEIRVKLYKSGLRDSRKCHMTGANNQLVADMFNSLLENRQFVITQDMLIKPDKDICYYYQSKFVEPYNYSKAHLGLLSS